MHVFYSLLHQQQRVQYTFYKHSHFKQCKGDCCGEQHMQLKVTCNAIAYGILVEFPDEFCTEPKPSPNTTCTRQDCPRWKTSNFGDCSTTCGEGERLRQVTCMSDGKEVDEALCRCQKRKPATVRVCENSSCPPITGL